MVGNILSNLIIGPLTMLFEMVFSVVYRIFDNPLLILAAMSLVVNLFSLPLYKRADAIQEEENKKQAEMKPWLDHIKRTFKGNERYMMTTTYYRQQNYKQWSALKGSISLLLQIPFFIAAYQYLSNLPALKTMSFWIFENLGEPDHLFYIGNFAVNILPIVMTLLNVISAIIYLKDCTASQKIQTYALAAFFLVFLYDSPAGLVIYWTCNQIFSLLKNIFLKLVKSKVVLGICVSVAGIAVFLAAFLNGKIYSPKRLIFFGLIFACCQIPIIIALIKRNKMNKATDVKSVGTKTHFLAATFLTLFFGAFIPLSVIASSATEFVSYSNTPVEIIVNNLSLMAGIFLVWESVYYFLAKTPVRNAFTYITFVVSGVAILDFFAYGQGHGFVSEFLIYDDTPIWTVSQKIVNVVAAAAIAVALWLLMKYFKKIMAYVCVVMIAGTVGLIVTNASTAIKDIEAADIKAPIYASEAVPEFELSREGQNIVFIMLDRAAASYVPYAFNERPELKDMFAGFTNYRNTLCFGAVTHQAAPALYGGYDYTPYEINKRENELLKEKHTEALMVVPAILSENNFESFIADPVYVGTYYAPYHLEEFSKYKNTKAENLVGKYQTNEADVLSEYSTKLQNRNMFFYSVMKGIPVIAQNTLYDGGLYFSTGSTVTTSDSFMKAFSELEALPSMTGVTNEKKNVFISLLNESTHQPTYLDPETYKPTAMDESQILGDTSRFTLDGVTMNMKTPDQIGQYYTLVASMIEIGNWLNYLKEQGVYDNTRIIIASDHGNGCKSFDSLSLSSTLNINRFMSLLLVKDFAASVWTESDKFMTNADVAALILEGVVENPVNPFTGNPISLDDPRKKEEQYVIETSVWDRSAVEKGNLLIGDDKPWAIATPGNLRDPENWEEIDFSKIDFSK